MDYKGLVFLFSLQDKSGQLAYDESTQKKISITAQSQTYNPSTKETTYGTEVVGKACTASDFETKYSQIYESLSSSNLICLPDIDNTILKGGYPDGMTTVSIKISKC